MIHPRDKQLGSKGFVNRLRNAGIVLRLVVFTLLMGSAFAFAAAVGWNVWGHHGVASAGLASFVCWGGSSSSMLVHSACGMHRFPHIAVFGGLTLRMFPALFAGFCSRYFWEGLAEAGFLVYLIVFFELALLVQIGFLTPFDTRYLLKSGFFGKKDISQLSDDLRNQRIANRFPPK